MVKVMSGDRPKNQLLRADFFGGRELYSSDIVKLYKLFCSETHSTPEFSMGLETDISVFSTTIPKRCEVFSSLFANIRRTFGEHFFEVRGDRWGDD